MSQLIRCQGCDSYYPAATPFPDSDQGHDCAANVYQRDGRWYIQGFYGSREIDMEIWRFVEEPSTRLQQKGTVCDRCVRRLKMSSKIVMYGPGEP